MAKSEFRALQHEWYEKLSNSGFNDIERLKGEELVLIQSSSYCFRNMVRVTREIKEEYFTLMAQMALDSETVYRNEADKHILTRYSEGAKIKIIMEELEFRGMRRRRNTVRFIIRRYEMIWGFRTYKPNELNKYKRK